MTSDLNRRLFLAAVGGAASAAWLRGIRAEDIREKGLVIGHPEAAEAGNAMLDAGGNAVDAIVTAALVAGVVAVSSTGIGGYGGHAVIGGLPGNKVTAIDFNSAAPAAFKADQFGASEAGEVPGKVNMYGWLAAGVPGVLAGLQLALDKFGTKKFSEVVAPAIKYARDGFAIKKNVAAAFYSARLRLVNDLGSANLFFADGKILPEGATFRNPDLAAMLESLAADGSVADFYQGMIAARIAAAFKAHGGLVTEADLAAYKAVEVAPLAFSWNGLAIHTPPPSSGGLTVLQTLSALQAAGWPEKRDAIDQTFIECLRVAWQDRLRLLGDPKQADVPIMKLLSEEYARDTAERVAKAIGDKKPLRAESDGRPAGGTIHLNAVDASGLAVALTLTHGEPLGAQVTVDGLGLVLGHGMSRFDPRAGRPNSPGPGKRPLHNMCPTVVTKEGAPVLAMGATGGRRIVSGVANVLARRIGEAKPLAEAVKAPRLHSEGGLALTAEEGWAADDLRAIGYAVTKGSVSSLSAIEPGGTGDKRSFTSATR
ncbi:MAG: gamma-glutamyltransferase family protein [Pirellulaceae bacterium]